MGFDRDRNSWLAEAIKKAGGQNRLAAILKVRKQRMSQIMHGGNLTDEQLAALLRYIGKLCLLLALGASQVNDASARLYSGGIAAQKRTQYTLCVRALRAVWRALHKVVVDLMQLRQVHAF
jgi:hypothetical protein